MARRSRRERAIPRDPIYDELLSALAPDVVLVTPGLHFGSGQADLMFVWNERQRREAAELHGFPADVLQEPV